MLYYYRIDINEGNNLAKSNNSKENIIFHYWLFNYGFEFQNYVYNGCHDLTMLSVNKSDITIITVKNVANNISKSEAINFLKNSVLEDYAYI